MKSKKTLSQLAERLRSAAGVLITGVTLLTLASAVYAAGSNTTLLVSHPVPLDDNFGFADDHSDWPSITANGRYVAFSSRAKNLLPAQADNDPYYDIYLYDREASPTTPAMLISANDSGPQDGDSVFGWITPAGDYITFQSAAENIGGDNGEEVQSTTSGWETDIFLYQVSSGQTVRVSLPDGQPSTGYTQEGNGHSGAVYAETKKDANGNTYFTGRILYDRANAHVATSLYVDGAEPQVFFESEADNLVIGDINGFKDIFLRNTSSNQTSLVSKGWDGSPADGASYNPLVSKEGRFLVFVSDATNLIHGQVDDNSKDDVFLLDRTTGKTYLISHVPGDLLRSGNNESKQPAIAARQVEGTWQVFVVFQSFASDLLPQGKDTNGVTDIFLYQITDIGGPAESSSLERVSVSSEGEQANLYSYRPSLSGDGRLVSFTSYASNLVAGDTNVSTSACIIPSEVDGTIISYNCPDIMIRDMLSRQTWRASLTRDGQQSYAQQTFSRLSDSGQYVVFSSNADMLNTEADAGHYKSKRYIYMRNQGNPPGNPNVQPTSYQFRSVGPATTTFTLTFWSGLSVDGTVFVDPSGDADNFEIFNDTCSNQTFAASPASPLTCQFSVRYLPDQGALMHLRVDRAVVKVPVSDDRQTLDISVSGTRYFAWLPWMR